jgi:type I restriction enzyme, S subunit
VNEARESNLDERVVRRFNPYSEYTDSGVEWLGAIPPHWGWQRLRHACRKITDGSHYSPPVVTDGWPYVTVRDLVEGAVDVDNAARISEDDFCALERSGCRPKIGDVLFSKDGSVGKVALVERADFVVLSSLAILRPGPNIQGSFLAYFLSSVPGVSQIASRFAGAALRRITLDVIVDLIASLPPRDEQRAITDFLDRETGKIDALIAKKEQLIELLQEKRTALITRAVTKGLDPSTPLKDSGIEWLGQIPAHWEVKKWRYCCHVTEGQVSPDDDRYRDRIMIAPNHIESGTGRILFTETADEQGAISGKYLVKPGDLIYSKIRPGLNKACIATGEWLCSADMYPVEVTTSDLRVRYLLHFVLSEPFVRLMVDESMRVAMPKVNREKLAACPLLIPPPPEQDRIATFVQRETARIDALTAKVRDAIDHLKEYRTAVISAAVTGKIDVREGVV